jgi:hypothetical protein
MTSRVPPATQRIGGDKDKTKDRRDFDRSVSCQNRRGEWVPAVPVPFYGFRKQCSCGAKFWTEKGYRGHFALEHILGLE